MMKHLFLYFLLCCFTQLSAQEANDRLHFLEAPDSLHSRRFYTALISGTVVYTGLMVGLNEAWYKDYPRSKFHLFNDGKEWEYMDKAGHFMTTYYESRCSYQGAKWTGIPRRKAIWLGAGLGLMYQSSIEVFDGFSTEWGFSVYDMLANTMGAGLFVGQELGWGEQRIVLKFSSWPPTYEELIFTDEVGNEQRLQQRVDELYGTSLPERILKDYNGQTIWASVNLRSFSNNTNTKIPAWLNVAVGYGADNMFGGFSNEWEVEETGSVFKIPDGVLTRQRQFYLSPDIDLTRIKTKSPLLRTLLFLANGLKVPAPALEVNTAGRVRFWWLK
jgi:Predicted periplasmic lipoprotein (DUF2279)